MDGVLSDERRLQKLKEDESQWDWDPGFNSQEPPHLRLHTCEIGLV